ncbi:rho GTPase-activating protein 31 [Echinops telfairi]|uniref:Rho GTPase-activating protein 31 n=1 Tax=Echinops telfairi TaxID=9371 RepID=A0AC55CPK1_ECHTE|nr:rho GTPase-activating protein 31 [Echinops telfairi]
MRQTIRQKSPWPPRGKAQDGVGEELLLQRRVPGITKDEAPKHSPSASSRACRSNCGIPAPMNLAAVSMSLEMVLVWKLRLGMSEVRERGAVKLLKRSSVSVSGRFCTNTDSVPYVLKSCAKFIETHGIVDGVYRLSGVTSNIQRLRQEFGSDQGPDLTREVYLQDIHCVGSLCKLYFRELPNPLLTYELYEKFTEAVSHCPEEDQLARIQHVIQELPPSHYRTLEYLIRHLAHIASFSSKTNMHARNLALVWAPNLLRSKEIEATGCNGDAAFLAVRVQQVVIEFILNHVDQIFSSSAHRSLENDGKNLFWHHQPIFLLALIFVPKNSVDLILVRKLSSKSKKWKSIFNLGRSGSDSKSKLNRNGSVFVRGQRLSVEKATIRPAKSMDSLCSVPAEGKETKGNFNRAVTTGGFFIPASKMHPTGSGSSCDLSKQEGDWGPEGMPAGAEGGFDAGAQARAPPEQLKVFRPSEDAENEQAAPKMLGMFYTSSDSPSRSGFASSLFHVEPSPRHQRKALNISEPFAVSVPLRVSAVISSNSTPCRTTPKELPSLSSLEELAFQGSEEKLPGAEASTASAPKKAAPEDAKPAPEAVGAMECSKSLSQEPGLQLEEKSPSEIPPGAEHSSEFQKRLDPEEVVEAVREAGHREPRALQESPRLTAEAAFLQEMDEDDQANALIWPEIQQELKIIESEEELSSPPPPRSLPKNSPTLPIPESSPEPSASPEAPRSSAPVPAPLEERANPSTLAASSAARGEEPVPTSSLRGSQRPDPASPCPLQIVALDEGSAPGKPPSLPLQPAPPPPTSLEEAPGPLPTKGSPERADPARDLRTNPCGDQLTSQGDFRPGEASNPGPGGKPNPQTAALQVKDPGVASPLWEVEIPPLGEGEVANSTQEPSDCDEDDAATAVAPHGLEMVEPWEEPQWVTSPLHSPTLKDVQGTQGQGLQGLRLEKRLSHRPSLRQSHSLDSKTTTNRSSWTLDGLSSSCANLDSEKSCDPLPPPTSRRGMLLAGWEEKAPRSFREFSGLQETEALPSQKGQGDMQPKPTETSPVNLAEGKEMAAEVGHDQLQSERGGSVPGGESTEHGSPGHVQDSASPREHPRKAQPKGTECGPPKGKHRPSSLNLDASVPITDLFRFENAASFGSPGMQFSEPGDSKAPQMTSSHSNADPWMVHSQDAQDLDIVAHTLMGRRNSAPVSVSAVRTSFMVKMCQARAVPVIPPKVQYTQIPQPLPAQGSGEGAAQPREKSPEEPSSVGGTSQKSAKDDSPLSSASPTGEKPKQDVGDIELSQVGATTASGLGEGPTLSPEAGSSNSLSTQDAVVQCRKRTSETEPPGDNLLSSKIERPSGGSKPFHRARPGRPQSLILFSPPFPIMDHPPPSSAGTDSRVLLSPIRSPIQAVSPGLLCGELAENTWVTPEGVTLRNKMTIPKNGQRLETSTSCFYQPQRRSVILDGRSGRQIE